MGFLQQFILVIKYKKGISNKVENMLSRPLLFSSIVLKNASLSHDSYIEQYATDEDFKEVYEKLTYGSHVENYHLQIIYSTTLESYAFLQVKESM